VTCLRAAIAENCLAQSVASTTAGNVDASTAHGAAVNRLLIQLADMTTVPIHA